MKKVGKGATLLVCLVAGYLLLGFVAWLVPDAPVRRHVEQSIASGDLGEDYPKAIVRDKYDCQDAYTMDNFTDALIINQVVCLRSEGLKGILLIPRHDEGVFQCHNLRQLMSGTEDGWTTHYGRYWHGTTFVARLMLAITSYTGIRYILYLLSSLLLLWCMLRLWRTVGKGATLALAAALLMVNVFVMQFSLQFVPVLMIALGGIVWLTYQHTKGAELLFLVLGSLTAFFDLITVPTITLGLPMVVWVAMRREDDLRQGIWMVVKLALWWLAGYVLTWASKWGLATLFTQENIFVNAYEQGSFWSKGGGSYVGEALSSNLKFLHWKYIVLVLAALVAMAAVHPRWQGWKTAVLFLFVALIPIAYYVVMAHPAQHHAWYNFRALATAVMALLMATAAMVDWKRFPFLKKCKLWTDPKDETR